jgi:asparagine synthase (glutamine-hydrolysing)
LGAGSRTTRDELAGFRPAPLEIACGRLLRPVEPLAREPAAGEALSPVEALGRAALPALADPPCFVSFSGGRDSSAVLAAAVDVARREGLPDPVPVSARFPDAPRSEEAWWQERVIGHLGLREWVRVDVDAGELDILGPRARSILERHGLIAPANIVFVSITLEAAAGGRLLTGLGGDDLFAEWRWRELVDALEGRRRVSRWDLLDAAYLLAPRRLRRALDRRHLDPPPPAWLRPAAAARARVALADERLGEPLRWPDWLRWCAGRVHLPAVRAAFAALSEDAGARADHPLLDPGFIAALGRAGGARGFGDRTTLMTEAFGSVLPEDVCARPDKAKFDEVYWSSHARAAAASWSGEGVDPELVDAEALRREFSRPLPDPRAWMLLQAAWLNGGVAAPTCVQHPA